MKINNNIILTMFLLLLIKSLPDFMNDSLLTAKNPVYCSRPLVSILFHFHKWCATIALQNVGKIDGDIVTVVSVGIFATTTVIHVVLGRDQISKQNLKVHYKIDIYFCFLNKSILNAIYGILVNWCEQIFDNFQQKQNGIQKTWQ